MTPNLLPFLAFNHGSNFWFIPGVSVPFPRAKIFMFVLARLGKKEGRKPRKEPQDGRRGFEGEGEKPRGKEKNQEGRRETEREEERRHRETEKGKHQGKKDVEKEETRQQKQKPMPTKKSKQKPQLTLGVIPAPTTIAAALANEIYS